MIDRNFFVSNFSKQIRELRLKSNLTQEQLGIAVGLSKQAINDIEKGRRLTTIDKAISIALYFNTTVEHLAGIKNSSNYNNQ